MRLCRSSDAGFTLVEAVVASSLVAMGAFTAVMLLGNLGRMNQFAAEYSDATFRAQEKFEELKGWEYDSLLTGTDSVGRYSRQWSVTDEPSTQHKAVVLTVSWTNLDGRARSVQMSTIRARDAL